MRLLLDTHILIWALLDSPRLSKQGADLILADGHDIFVSAVSVWEIAIKRSADRRTRPPFSGSEAIRFSEEAGFRLLSVTAAHSAAVEDLPRLHGDPFDRLIVAQALTEPLVLLTHDATVARYSDSILHV